MAAPVCSVAQFTSSTIAPCLKLLTHPQRLSALIYFNALELLAIGGTDYTAQLGHAGLLMSDSECFHQQLAFENTICSPTVPYLVIAYNNATNAGAVPAATPNTITAAIACNVDFTPDQKAAQLLLLTCSLGTHKAYPQ